MALPYRERVCEDIERNATVVEMDNGFIGVKTEIYNEALAHTPPNERNNLYNMAREDMSKEITEKMQEYIIADIPHDRIVFPRIPEGGYLGRIKEARIEGDRVIAEVILTKEYEALGKLLDGKRVFEKTPEALKDLKKYIVKPNKVLFHTTPRDRNDAFVFAMGEMNWNNGNFRAPVYEGVVQAADVGRLHRPPTSPYNDSWITKTLGPLEITEDPEHKANRLLRRLVGDKEFKRYREHHYVEIHSKKSDYSYQVYGGHEFTQVYVGRRDNLAATLCVTLPYTGQKLPDTDATIMRVLMIRNNEDEFWRIAVSHPVGAKFGRGLGRRRAVFNNCEAYDNAGAGFRRAGEAAEVAADRMNRFNEYAARFFAEKPL